ncbi:hypothetical protein GLAREA_12237 [Glarea lozoyensis ATCC 20868]|uniref:Uncharacterized protein n=1 Tax=Glarea lozoyensis (strain ATCC 20868 / MF5171) TaxID=1116229 RepID=S3DHG9_GLAL2|nr:uncharacterized protein GLAREA_12237 [Glarea lozoyensis ATCC 20868]EPE31481.1 hypothetical protein GLAREA_12237 [Glarea lozoyensis ATCC 20868]
MGPRSIGYDVCVVAVGRRIAAVAGKTGIAAGPVALAPVPLALDYLFAVDSLLALDAVLAFDTAFVALQFLFEVVVAVTRTR